MGRANMACPLGPDRPNLTRTGYRKESLSTPECQWAGPGQACSMVNPWAGPTP